MNTMYVAILAHQSERVDRPYEFTTRIHERNIYIRDCSTGIYDRPPTDNVFRLCI